jgi:hypothetical protein
LRNKINFIFHLKIMNRIEILPNLWIGTIKSANNKEFNTLTNISIFINADNELNLLEYKYEKLYTLTNYEIIKLNNNLSKIIKYIFSQLTNNIAILIYSNTIPNLSILIIYSYIIKYGKLNKEIATNIIKSKYSDSEYSINLFNELFDKIIL